MQHINKYKHLIFSLTLIVGSEFMVSRKKYIVTIIAVVLVTAILTLSLGNMLMVEAGQKVVLSKETYNQMKNMYEKYAKQESVMEIAKRDFLYEADA